MGFTSNGLSSIRMNHGMLSSRGSCFKKYRKFINVDVDYIEVDEARMERIARDARRATAMKLIVCIVVATAIVVCTMFL